ncbi:hypothetical protein M2360_003103 [Rhizobium sp. SG_E_25_P2]|uniref:hypothetical protein n=1 Tax=Rhizobium sp. SG_E_25_P2 TaxID=2879942 RepID=UPI0024751BF5|nr:hypothetical protein [Rhizobium sp. SG_E_25_P2]MDH6267706.1 hypothetical protein [Rhizobium sp. SG_E_25_P2]
MTEPLPLSREPVYAQRRFRSAGVFAQGDKRFKLMLISAEVANAPYAARPDIVEAAKAYCETLLSDMDATPHFDVGSVILHDGEASANNWLLFDWWIEGGIGCRIMSRSMKSRPLEFTRVEGPFAACVWEAVVIEHERKAWKRQALSGPRSLDAYLDDFLADGLH